jgi:hypothetical protein
MRVWKQEARKGKHSYSFVKNAKGTIIKVLDISIDIGLFFGFRNFGVFFEILEN